MVGRSSVSPMRVQGRASPVNKNLQGRSSPTYGRWATILEGTDK